MRTSQDVGCFPLEFVQKIEGFYPTMVNLKSEIVIYDYESLLKIMGYSIDIENKFEKVFENRFVWRKWKVAEKEEFDIAGDCGKNIEDISENEFRLNILSANNKPISYPKLKTI